MKHSKTLFLLLFTAACITAFLSGKSDKISTAGDSGHNASITQLAAASGDAGAEFKTIDNEAIFALPASKTAPLLKMNKPAEAYENKFRPALYNSVKYKMTQRSAGYSTMAAVNLIETHDWKIAYHESSC